MPTATACSTSYTRPFPVLEQGSRVSQVALLHGGNDVAAEYRHIQTLCERYSILPPAPGSSCYYQNFGGFELRWERHTEFSTYTFIHRVDGPEPFQRTALSLLPPGWLAELPGEVISGLHIEIIAMPEPAFRTCEAVSGQLDKLSRRIDRASELLRTRVDLTLEAQNQDLLQSMNNRSQVQLQLQQAVEGLSVVAISYYMVGLVKYMAGSLHEMGVLHYPELWVGVSVPVCVLLVWRGVKRLRKQLVG